MGKLLLFLVLQKISIIRGGIFVLRRFLLALFIIADLLLRSGDLKRALANPVLGFDVDVILGLVLAQEMTLKIF
jgi:hypothetical protein